MTSLLARLNVDHFVLDLAEPLTAKPELDGCHIEDFNDKTLSISVPKSVGLNALFEQLTAKNIKILSLKNRSNRLEQLFMDLIDSKTKGNAA